MLNDDHSVAGIYEFADNLVETLNIVHVQSGGRLIHDIYVALLAQFGYNLQALVLAARQRTECLAEFQVTETHFLQKQKITYDFLLIGKEADRFLYCHVKHFGDVLSAIQKAKSLLVVSFTFTLLASSLDSIEEIHLKAQIATALTLGTSSSCIEAEQRSILTISLGKELPQMIEDANI